MRRILLLILITSIFFLLPQMAMTQIPGGKYTSYWKSVQTMIEKGRPATAYSTLQKIYTLAKEEKEELQVIRALIYMRQIQSQLRENNETLSIAELEKELKEASPLARAILQNMLAEYHLRYYQKNNYKIYARTNMVDYKAYDIDSWSPVHFRQHITALYLASLENEELLQQNLLEQFSPILIEGNARILRPTLYDLLCQRALEYFMNDEREIHKAYFAADLDRSAVFEAAGNFIGPINNPRDSVALRHPALQLYRKLLLFHLNDQNPAALIDADIHRIVFAREKSVHPDKDSLYLDALSRIYKLYKGHPAATLAAYRIAAFFEKQGNEWRPFGDTTYRYQKVKARRICEEVLQEERASEGKTNCQNLLASMTLPQVDFETENVNIPEQPFRILVTYKNTPRIWLRMARMEEPITQISDRETFNRKVLGLKALREWQQDLPSTADLQEHRAEIKIDALPPGKYMLIMGSAPDFQNPATAVMARRFYISGITYIKRENELFILDRNSGQPLADAMVQTWEKKIVKGRLITEKGYLFTTDSNGHFQLKTKEITGNKDYLRTISYDIINKEDRLFLEEDPDRYYYNRPLRFPGQVQNNTRIIYFFSDRAIYRPGQELIFKGIVLTKDSTGRKGNVVQDYPIVVYLKNVNGKKEDSLQLVTGAYGSFNGRFRLPMGGLTGNFSLECKDNYGTHHFRVEEYKRPHYYGEFEPMKALTRLEDSITVTGMARAYAGNAIDGAKVNYRISRRTKYIYNWRFRNRNIPWSQETSLFAGETQTDPQGRFLIRFKALPDPTVDRNLDPVFEYSISADITDLNGETRHCQTLVTAGYQLLKIVADIPSRIDMDSLHTLPIRTENLNGQFVKAAVKITISKLADEHRLIRERYWNRPDQFVMTKKEYLRYFPFDEYDNESIAAERPIEKVMHTEMDSTNQEGRWHLKEHGGINRPGFYLINIQTTDAGGYTIIDQQLLEVIDQQQNRISNPEYLYTNTPSSLLPGQTAPMKIGSSAENVFLIQLTQKGNRFLLPESDEYSFIRLNNESKTFPISASETDQGGLGIQRVFVKNNRIYKSGSTIYVPWTDKDLKLEYISFRDRTTPGHPEEWKIRISGYRKNMVNAELLASLSDASLDQILSKDWTRPFPWGFFTRSGSWESGDNFNHASATDINEPIAVQKTFIKQYDQLLNTILLSSSSKRKKSREAVEPLMWLNPLNYVYEEERSPRLMRLPKPVLPDSDGDGVTDEIDQELTTTGCPVDERGVSLDSDQDGIPDCKDSDGGTAGTPKVKARTHLQETAFFFPQLTTDSLGIVTLRFTMPESLTQWKFQALAHTHDLAFGYIQRMTITQKQLMVQPNMPRFVRESDQVSLNSKLVNMSSHPMSGEAILQVFDAITDSPIDSLLGNLQGRQKVNLPAGQSIVVKFPIRIPASFDHPLRWRIICTADAATKETFSDGEENMLPVLPKRMLVTETLPLHMRGTGTQSFSFPRLISSQSSSTLAHHSLTIDYTTNPYWQVAQSLPFLMEYPYECAEQTWNRFYGNSLASHILKLQPGIKKQMLQWVSDSSSSNALWRNQAYTGLMAEETPWLKGGNSNADRKKNLAALFDEKRLKQEQENLLQKVLDMQSRDGAFSWFPNGPADRYITQYILSGIGHLKKAGAWNATDDAKLQKIIQAALYWLDELIEKQFREIKKSKDHYTLSPVDVQYLYMRSYFSDFKSSVATKAATDYLLERCVESWISMDRSSQAMMALIFFRNGQTDKSREIMRSLKERMVRHDEMGMYPLMPAENWFWHQAPIETQALLIEAFREAGNDESTVNELRTWLLKNKQTNNWKTTRATAEACYALLLQGNGPASINGINSDPVIDIRLGNYTISSAAQPQEAGTGYFKQSIEGNKVDPQMGNISVTVSSPDNKAGATWGAAYWQYFEDLDKITTAATPLKLVKKLFVEKNSDRGPVLTPVNDGDVLKVGDKIKVRVELRVDRDMEYVHMKDMRASALEPVNVLSQYKWQGGLGYYESTKDASTNFFFSYLRKGTYVFEYPLFVTHTGNFSNGITSIQCMYAPEFSSHSEGVRITVE